MNLNIFEINTSVMFNLLNMKIVLSILTYKTKIITPNHLING